MKPKPAKPKPVKPIEIRVNTRDEHGRKQPLDKDVAEALGHAMKAIYDHYAGRKGRAKP